MPKRHLLLLTTAAGCLGWLVFAVYGADPAPPAAAYVPDPAFPAQPMPPVLSPEEELKTIQLPAGYHLELVLSEPVIREPVLCVFDGNGRMYVAEMRTYMQDADATGELTPGSRISRHESSQGDGVFDRHSVFLDHALLPRLVLPLDRGQVLAGMTDTYDIDLYTDTKDAGVADGKRPFYVGGNNGGNMEHQPSGPLWAMDNWLYTTYNDFRLRWTPEGKVLKEPTGNNGGQWGISQDDHGKLWWSNAGAEKALWHFQTPVLYGGVDVKDQFENGFMEVWPSIGLADFQGGPPRSRADKTLNHFTGCCGQEVFRGDRLPADLRGDVLLPEPVGRLIRRAKVVERDGMTVINNPYQTEHGEFIRSTDPYFRPVWTTTGPDGCLYIVDMYRGIIQEGNWTRPGSYLRKVVDQYEIAKNIGHGRIWRLVHDGFQPGPPPHMLDETPAQLVTHLDHPNGWWRDQAQKLLVLRQDRSVVPALLAMTRTSANPLAREHALWTLEGLGAADPALIREKLQDQDPNLRAAAIRVSETLFKQGDVSLKPDIVALVIDANPAVALQAAETAKILKWTNWQSMTMALMTPKKPAGLREIGGQLLHEPRTFDRAVFGPVRVKLLEHGQAIYQQLCFACHGADGHGMPMEGLSSGTTLAPPLAGSGTALAPHESIVSVLLRGVTGPINGKTYDGMMPPQGANDDEWIASIASYVRNSFGNHASVITPQEVAAVRAANKDRLQPWTVEELKMVVPQPLNDRREWKVSASPGADTAAAAVDGKMSTAYTTGVAQGPNQWYQIELPRQAPVTGLELQSRSDEYPRQYKVEASVDGNSWDAPLASGEGTGALTQISFPAIQTRFIRITQTAGSKDHPWSIVELQLLGPPEIEPPPKEQVMLGHP